MRVRKGQVLLAVGLPATDVYVVLEGSVSVSLVSAQGRETVLRAIGAREMFGELAAIDGEPRSADVVAVENSTLLVIPGPTLPACWAWSRSCRCGWHGTSRTRSAT